MKRQPILALGAVLLSATTALAHDGHGDAASGLWHYLVEPEHLVALLAVGLGVGGLLFLLRRLRLPHRSGQD